MCTPSHRPNAQSPSNNITASPSITASPFHRITTIHRITHQSPTDEQVIHYNDAKIQLLDLPGIIEGAAEGKGRGRQVIAVCKSADLLLMVLDAAKPWHHREIIERELEAVGMRLNR